MTNGRSLDARLYLDVNSFARHSAFAHGFMAFYAHDFGLVLLGLLLLAAWWRARSRPDPARAVARALWVAAGTVVAWGLAHYVLKPAIAERRPYLVLPHVEVLLGRTNEFSFPSGHATVAGAVILGLWLCRDYLLGTLATVVGLLLAFGRVYTGMHYPGDVLGGLVFGAAVLVVLWVPAVGILSRFDRYQLDHRTLLAPLVAARR